MAPDIPLLGLVGLGGFEPPTSPLSGVRSDQLSYRPGVSRVCMSFPTMTMGAPRQPGQSRGNEENR